MTQLHGESWEELGRDYRLQWKKLVGSRLGGELRGSCVGCRKLVDSGLGWREHDIYRLRNMTQV